MAVGAWRSLVARWHGGPEVARSSRVAPTIKFLTCLISSLFIFSLNSASSSLKCGWVLKRGYYRPFVLIESPYRKFVLFITPDGKVYKGKCKKRFLNKNLCKVFPGKRFKEPVPLRFIILEKTLGAPLLIKSGVIE